MLLNFSDRTRTGAFNMVWSYTFTTHCSVAVNKNAVNLEQFSTARTSAEGGGRVIQVDARVISGLSSDLKKYTRADQGIAAKLGFDTHLLKCNFKRFSLVV